MPNITFYQLDTESQDDINNFICDLCHSFYKTNRHIYILCPNQDYCYQLDEHIITYHKTNFFPYSLLGEGPIPPAQICLGSTIPNKLKFDILINLHSIIPDNFIKYRDVIELVAKNEEMRVLSREHYKHYHKFSYKIEFTKAAKEVEVINEQ